MVPMQVRHLDMLALPQIHPKVDKQQGKWSNHSGPHSTASVCSSTMPLEPALDWGSSLLLAWPLPFPVSLQLGKKIEGEAELDL